MTKRGSLHEGGTKAPLVACTSYVKLPETAKGMQMLTINTVLAVTKTAHMGFAFMN